MVHSTMILGRIVVLGIVYSRVEEVLPFVIQTALDMGLTVFDGQDDSIYRPDMTTLAHAVVRRSIWVRPAVLWIAGAMLAGAICSPHGA
jgi:hypothetical protein